MYLLEIFTSCLAQASDKMRKNLVIGPLVHQLQPLLCPNFEGHQGLLTFFYQNVFGEVLDLLQLSHGRNLKYLVNNGVLKLLGQVINPEEIK